jgi:hypothetical protein
VTYYYIIILLLLFYYYYFIIIILLLDADGRPLGREVFKLEAPSALGVGKWSVKSRGFNPNYTSVDYVVQSKLSMSSTSSSISSSSEK